MGVGVIDTAMILAAGRGERMRPFTDTCPKPLARLAGKPLIEYHVEKLASVGIERIVINLSWLGEQVRSALGAGERYGVEILYSDEGATLLGTGGGIQRAMPLLRDRPFWVMSADLWTDYPFAQATAERWLASADLAHVVMVDNPDFHPEGDFCLQSGRMTESEGERLTYANVALMRPELFFDCKPGVYSFVPYLRAAMRQGRVSGERFTGRWHNIGTLAQLQALEGLLLSGNVSCLASTK